ncbi:MAG: 30S ribosomal protein S6 [Candidatus Falkowbacteria bacterium]|nr:30S ribosomal protein S6 [Candidatus Falkowbacteria bacterium]
MSKTKKSEQNHYEMLFIIPNKFTEDEAKVQVSKVEELIASQGGEITYREYWGKKRLAYEIKQNHYGYYSLCEFDINRLAIAKIDNDLRLSKDVLRHQIVVTPVLSGEERARQKSLSEKLAVKKEDGEKKAKANEEEIKKTPSVVSEETNSSKELDEKMEGILSAQDLL